MASSANGKGMTDPSVVLTPIASIDGRIVPDEKGPLLDPQVSQRWGALWAEDTADLVKQRSTYLRERFAPRVTLEGAGSFISNPAATRRRPSDEAHPRPPARFLRTEAESWLAVTDSQGRVDWSHPRKGATELLVLISKSTPGSYVRALRDREISYMTVGSSQVDLRRAARELAALTGSPSIIGAGGGHLNGALWQAGLVSELHLITIPALIGVSGSTSILEGATDPAGKVTRIREVQGGHGSAWTHYKLGRSAR